MLRRTLERKGATGKLTTGQIEDLIMGRGWSMEALLDERPDFVSEDQRRATWERFKDRIYHEMGKHGSGQRHPAAHYDYDGFVSADLQADRCYLRRDEDGPGLPYGLKRVV
jgi:hypothetical protein